MRKLTMSIISTYQVDNSGSLAKQFAATVAGFFDNADAARSVSAKVPLENLFRMLEMFKYDAFADESRRGVLALDVFTSNLRHRSDTSQWHAKIKEAMTRSLNESFNQVAKEQAIDQLQDSLRSLAKGEPVSEESRN